MPVDNRDRGLTAERETGGCGVPKPAVARRVDWPIPQDRDHRFQEQEQLVLQWWHCWRVMYACNIYILS